MTDAELISQLSKTREDKSDNKIRQQIVVQDFGADVFENYANSVLLLI